ncbi:MAG TPA: hypothetical protein VFH03_15060 [Actinoplanes sp.]|nr:hypothetical protein [Actinoplanes sp.]
MTRPEDLDMEAPEADAAEQATLAEPDDEQPGASYGSVGLETPEWDAQEQAMPVPVDDDYR